MQLDQEHRSRRQFIGFLGGTLGAGLGLMALPTAALAKAASGRPSPDNPASPTLCNGTSCTLNPCSCGSGIPYWCTNASCSYCITESTYRGCTFRLSSSCPC